jgi:hypothetical protein
MRRTHVLVLAALLGLLPAGSVGCQSVTRSTPVTEPSFAFASDSASGDHPFRFADVPQVDADDSLP